MVGTFFLGLLLPLFVCKRIVVYDAGKFGQLNGGFVALNGSEGLLLDFHADEVVSFVDRWIIGGRVVWFGTSLQSLERHYRFSFDETQCLRYNNALRNNLVFMVTSLYMNHVTVIIDDTICSKLFHSLLLGDLSKRPEGIQLETIWMSHKTDEDKLLQQFYSMKTSRGGLIVMLAPYQYHAQILSISTKFDLIETSDWLVPMTKQFSAGLDFKRIIMFKIDDRWMQATYENISEKLTLINQDDMQPFDLSRFSCFVLSCQPQKVNVSIVERHKNVQGSRYQTKYTATVTVKEFRVQNTGEMKSLSSTSSIGGRRSLRVVTILDAPFTMEGQMAKQPVVACLNDIGVLCKKMQGNQTVVICCTGFVVSLFTMVTNMINVDFDLYLVEDNKYGAMDVNGEWNGMIADLIHGKADVAIAGLTITELRSQYVDFAFSYMKQEMGILSKPVKTENTFFSLQYLDPLSGDLKLYIPLMLICTVFLNFIIENNILLLNSCREGDKVKYYSFYESLSYIGGVSLQRDIGGKIPTRLASKVFALVLAFGMLIYITAYTAKLAARNVRYHDDNIFQGSSDPRMRNPTEDYTFGILRDTSYETFFRSSESDVLKRMSKFMQDYNVDSTFEGVSRVHNGSLDAFISDYAFLSHYISQTQSCTFRLIPDKLASGSYGFAMRKSMPVAEAINQAIRELTENGETTSIETRWFKDACQPTLFANTQTSFPLEFNVEYLRIQMNLRPGV